MRRRDAVRAVEPFLFRGDEDDDHRTRVRARGPRVSNVSVSNVSVSNVSGFIFVVVSGGGGGGAERARHLERDPDVDRVIRPARGDVHAVYVRADHHRAVVGVFILLLVGGRGVSGCGVSALSAVFGADVFGLSDILPECANCTASIVEYAGAHGLEESSAEGASARRSLESARSHVPEECRFCRSCGARKPKAEYSDNQWRKGQRRCKACQDAGISTSVAQRVKETEEEEEASAMRKLYQQQVEAEEQAVQEKLKRLNENERTDAECAICIDEIAPEQRLVLHGTMHWLCAGCLEDMLAPSRRPIRCHMCREELDEEKLRAVLTTAAAASMSAQTEVGMAAETSAVRSCAGRGGRGGRGVYGRAGLGRRGGRGGRGGRGV